MYEHCTKYYNIKLSIVLILLLPLLKVKQLFCRLDGLTLISLRSAYTPIWDVAVIAYMTTSYLYAGQSIAYRP